MNRIPPDWLDKLTTFAYFGTLGAFAAFVGYLVQLAKQEGRATFAAGIITCITGFYLGMLFGVLVPGEWTNRDAIVLLIGATGVKGFELISGAVRELAPDWIKKVFGPK